MKLSKTRLYLSALAIVMSPFAARLCQLEAASAVAEPQVKPSGMVMSTTVDGLPKRRNTRDMATLRGAPLGSPCGQIHRR